MTLQWLDGMDIDDDGVSLLDSDGVFLALFRLGRGNFTGGIPSFSLFVLVSGCDGMYCEVTLPWDNSDYSWDIENPCSL